MPHPYHLNGKLYSADEAAISVEDGGFLRGEGVFETLITYKGKPFMLAAHHARLVVGAERQGILAPSLEDVEEAVTELLAEMDDEGSRRLRITLSSGQKATPTLLITQGALPEHPRTAHLRTSSYTRNPQSALAGIKALSYAENSIALREAKGAGADEALIRSVDGSLCEGSSSNIFAFLRGQWVTPPLESGCLPGITRGLVLRLCQDADIQVVEEPLVPADIPEIEECFLTSSLREIQPVHQIDGLHLPEAPGPLTRSLQKLYREEVEKFLAA